MNIRHITRRHALRCVGLALAATTCAGSMTRSPPASPNTAPSRPRLMITVP